jgi:hypothetical protein
LREVGYIILLLLFTVSCSVSRKNKSVNSSGDNSSASVNLLQSIINQNLTSRSFYIEKAEFKIISGGNQISGIGTIKFLKPDKFLISIKSIVGIEIARIYLTGDSIIANDRINKKFYFGSTSILKSKYGITTSVLPVVFGDYVNDERPDSTRFKCVAGNIQVDGSIKEVKIRYLIDCAIGKSILTIPEDSSKNSMLKIVYSDFFSISGINTPGLINISDTLIDTIIEIRIQKIIIPWDGTIDFIPGKQYEKIRLL